jgi:flagellum-specific peptidoglycan hydrolase FlgJ
MRKIITLCVLVIVVFSCGTNKVTVRKKASKRTKTEQVVNRNVAKENVNRDEAVVETVNGVEVKITSTEDYVALFKTIAQDEMRLYGIPASITIAQGILESNSGKGRLSVEANNHFGIKCHEWTGDRIFHDDDASQECFRKYSDAKYSYRDHSLFLTQRQRYSALFKLRKEDYKGWARELKKAGYATDSKYPEKLISLIERYELHKFDEEVLGGDYVKFEYPKVASASSYIVEKGDSMYSISKKFNLTVKELQDLNNLSNTSLSIGQKLITARSAGNSLASASFVNSKSALITKLHIVEKGDTLYSISKKYNVPVSELQEINNLSDTAISIGQELQIKNR